MLTIVALDPGGTTGWGLYQKMEWQEDVAFYRGPPDTVEHFRCGELRGDNHHVELWELLGSVHRDEFWIVCESFEYRNDYRPGLELISKEYIGVVNLYARLHQLEDHLVFQTASQGKVRPKGFIKKENLEHAGLWSPTRGNHAMDGYGHLLYWLINGPEKRYDLLKMIGK